MKNPKPVAIGFCLAALSLLSACASPSSRYADKEVNVLGGLFKYEEDAYMRQGPLTFGIDSSDLSPVADLDGDSVSLLWGLITYVDE